MSKTPKVHRFFRWGDAPFVENTKGASIQTIMSEAARGARPREVKAKGAKRRKAFRDDALSGGRGRVPQRASRLPRSLADAKLCELWQPAPVRPWISWHPKWIPPSYASSDNPHMSDLGFLGTRSGSCQVMQALTARACQTWDFLAPEADWRALTAASMCILQRAAHNRTALQL